MCTRLILVVDFVVSVCVLRGSMHFVMVVVLSCVCVALYVRFIFVTCLLWLSLRMEFHLKNMCYVCIISMLVYGLNVVVELLGVRSHYLNVCGCVVGRCNVVVSVINM